MAVELIEAKLVGMNDDAFHRMGDQYLFYEYGVEYDAINPIGQTEGKQKSRGGTPDTTFKLKNGKFALVQYTNTIVHFSKSLNKLLDLTFSLP